jgi:predicted aspartyl protease
MTIPFDPTDGSILVAADITGPVGPVTVQLALDTGATRTLINRTLLVNLGYDPAAATEHAVITTASGVEPAPILPLNTFAALGQDRTAFPVLCHDLPPSANVDGLLGLDFLRGLTLTIDFRKGYIELV